MRLEGVVRFHDPPRKPLDATLRVQLLDASSADASSVALADQTIQGVSLGPEGADGGVSFAFDAPELSPGGAYSLAAHVDVSGNGEIEVGDYITMESVPFEPRSASAQLEIPVRRVKS